MLEPLYTADEMRAAEAGHDVGELMERAGEGLAQRVGELASTGRIAVVCGRGNNGGDGLVAARLLRRLGREVDVLLLADPSEYQGDAATQLGRLQGPPPRPFAATPPLRSIAVTLPPR